MRKLVSKEQFKIDQENDLVAYIDEAGDEGFNSESSRWFVVGCVVLKYGEYLKARANLDQFKVDSGRLWKNIHFKSLQHNKRKDLCAYIAKSEYGVIISCFSKFDLSKEEKYLSSYPSMYFVGVKNILERVSWYTQQHKAPKVHIMIGNRNQVKAENLKKYLFETSKNAKKNHSYYDHIGNVVVGNQEEYGIKLADCITSSVFQLLEPYGVAQQGDRTYYDLCIKGKLYSSNHNKYGGIWSNGLKCTPQNRSLIDSIDLGILTEDQPL